MNEAAGPAAGLPDPLCFEDGRPVTSADEWADRRAEILALFEVHVYGRTPSTPHELTVALRRREVVDGLLVIEFRASVEADRGVLPIDVLVFAPASADGATPAFLVPNFLGNHTVHPDPAIGISEGADRDLDRVAPRGERAARFPVDDIVGRGWALVTWYYGDADPDVDDRDNGVHRLYDDPALPVPGDRWGAVGAWAWGNSRVLDALHDIDEIDHAAVVVGGHSRLGKAALWAGARDERFVAAFANDSGSTGAAISRRRSGEDVAAINALFPHWFAANYRRYADREDELPVDQHQLLALMAPRPVHVGSAEEDAWADPLGEFLGARGAEPVYELLGGSAATGPMPPPVGSAVIGDVSYHVRRGGHDLTAEDWRHYLDSADRAIGR